MCFVRTAYCWALPSFAVSLMQPSLVASAVELEKSFRWKATWSPRYTMRVYIQSGFFAHWMSGAHLILGLSVSTSSFGFVQLFCGGMMVWESERKFLGPKGRLSYLINNFNVVTLSSNCGTKFEDGVGVLKLGKVESTSWGRFKKPQLATSTLTSISKIRSWGHEVEALNYQSWRSSWGRVGGLWTTLLMSLSPTEIKKTSSTGLCL